MLARRGQAIGEHAAGRASADDNVVEFFMLLLRAVARHQSIHPDRLDFAGRAYHGSFNHIEISSHFESQRFQSGSSRTRRGGGRLKQRGLGREGARLPGKRTRPFSPASLKLLA
jgi:hypothetical protein